MRGIAELVEVSNAPPTPSPVTLPSATQFNGMGVAGNPPDSGVPASNDVSEDANKTPEPPVTTPPSSTAPVCKTVEAQVIPTKPQEGSGIDSPNTHANFAKMRSRLAHQMGLSSETDLAGDDMSNGSSDRASHSPSQSPVVQRRAAKAPAPPPPKRGAATSLAPNRHSLSSSTSSLSSNQSERIPGSHDQRGSVEVPIATQQQVAPRAGGKEEVDGLTPAKKSFSVEDITAALDDMVEGDVYLKENTRGGGGTGGAKATPPAVSDAKETGDEMDALSRALQGFSGEPGTQG